MLRGEKAWIAIFILLLLIVILGSLFFISRYPSNPPVEILLPTPAHLPLKEVYIGGEVNNPGIYPLKPGDSLEELIKSAGGLKPEADIERIRVYIPKLGETLKPQRVNINTAEAWLLTALPGIGPKLAEAIVSYRIEKGPFRSPKDLLNVPGIGPHIYEKVKDLITVGE